MRKPFLNILLCLILSACGFSNNDYLNYKIPLARLIDSLAIQQNSLHILIDKSDYKLTVLSDSIILKEYPVVLGGNPTDDKLRQGDECTPEGIFHIVSKYPHKAWSKFIWLNYPTENSWEKHNKAKQEGLIPEDAKIGGEIGIHGVPSGMDQYISLKYNWTLGCISLKNEDVNEVYPYIINTTKIEIRK